MARITSGAIQYGVPTNVFAGQDTDAEPKSATEANTVETIYRANTANHYIYHNNF